MELDSNLPSGQSTVKVKPVSLQDTELVAKDIKSRLSLAVACSNSDEAKQRTNGTCHQQTNGSCESPSDSDTPAHQSPGLTGPESNCLETSHNSQPLGKLQEDTSHASISFEIEYVSYTSELQMPDIMKVIQKDLSEPYSIYTYRYFIHNWPKLCFL
ncbi:uncharacterized protein LOC106646329, partial [Copidosoma floridanum]|uniref:uncharacterized protein LOC106646329 n=1 Tax=Copidosoma floridanum TaxID=29053 RepID=UPI0006C979A2